MAKLQRRGKEEHEKALQSYITKAYNEGRTIIDLAGKSPDAIEAYLENGKIKLRAIEVLPIRWRKSKNTWTKTHAHYQKKESYRMFDDVEIVPYKLLYSKPKD